jgi:hypothetical protein
MKRLLLLLSLITVIVISGCTNQEGPQKADTTATSSPTTTATSPTELTLKVGETAKTSKIEVTVITAQKTSYYEYYSEILGTMTKEASPGKTFVLIEVEIKNIGSDRVFVGSSEFSMTDSEGYKYDPQLYYGQSTDGLDMIKELYQNQKMKGKVLFEVPESATGLKIQYDFGNLFIGVKLATWEIS